MGKKNPAVDTEAEKKMAGSTGGILHRRFGGTAAAASGGGGTEVSVCIVGGTGV